MQVKKPGHLIRQRWASAFCLNMIAVKPDYEAGQNEFCNNRSIDGSLENVYLWSECKYLNIPVKTLRSSGTTYEYLRKSASGRRFQAFSADQELNKINMPVLIYTTPVDT